MFPVFNILQKNWIIFKATDDNVNLFEFTPQVPRVKLHLPAGAWRLSLRLQL